MPKKKSPFNRSTSNRGAVVAVRLEDGLWCYVREFALCHGFLPFFSKDPLEADKLLTLTTDLYFDLWCYDYDETPMVYIGEFPFMNEKESYGQPSYIEPDVIEPCYTIHEIHNGEFRLRKVFDEAEVSGFRLQNRIQPGEFGGVLSGKTSKWATL